MSEKPSEQEIVPPQDGERRGQLVQKKAGERVVIDDQAVVTMLGVRDGVVRLSIEPPQEVRVRYGEVHAAIQAERTAKSASAKPGQPEGADPRKR